MHDDRRQFDQCRRAGSLRLDAGERRRRAEAFDATFQRRPAAAGVLVKERTPPRLGLGYDYRGIAALARLVGPAAAKDILFSARFLESDEALRLGLVNTVVDEAQLEAHVTAYAGRIAANAPLTVHAAKRAVQVFEHDADDPRADEIAALVLRCFDSDDYKEGRRAFIAKRPPAFQGR